MLTSILSHFSFANCIVDFFSNYLVGRSTQYSWNSFLSGACNADVGMRQGSTLSPILSALYIALLIHIFEHRAQALNLNTCILSFVDDGLLISQRKTYNKTLPELYSSYRVVTNLMVTFGLVMEHDKSEIFHFSRAHNDSNPELDLSAIGAPTLKPKTYWRYLGFYFDRHLSFKEHVWFLLLPMALDYGSLLGSYQGPGVAFSSYAAQGYSLNSWWILHLSHWWN